MLVSPTTCAMRRRVGREVTQMKAVSLMVDILVVEMTVRKEGVVSKESRMRMEMGCYLCGCSSCDAPPHVAFARASSYEGSIAAHTFLFPSYMRKVALMPLSALCITGRSQGHEGGCLDLARKRRRATSSCRGNGNDGPSSAVAARQPAVDVWRTTTTTRRMLHLSTRARRGHDGGGER